MASKTSNKIRNTVRRFRQGRVPFHKMKELVTKYKLETNVEKSTPDV